jgi:acylphosphatase
VQTDDDQTPSRVTILVLGEVQGVFFRPSALEQAQSLSLTGWVKNLADGSVELIAEGPRFKLEQLVAWCREGPPAAKVEDVITRYGKFTGEFRTFMISR